jgi:amino acid adenylation domain-containing protein
MDLDTELLGAIERLRRDHRGLTIVDRGRRLGPAELAGFVEGERRRLAGARPGPVFLRLGDRAESIARLCGALAAGLKPVVLPERIPAAELAALRRAYAAVPYAGPAGLVDADDRPMEPPAVDAPYLLVVPTSGSTGAARLVAASGAAIARAIAAIAASQGLAAVGTTGLLLPPHYSFALVNQVIWSIVTGARLVLTPGLATPGETFALLAAEHAEMLCLVGRQARALARLGFDAPSRALPAVKVVNFAGGPFPIDCLAAIRRLFPQARILNNYGCTEAFPRVSAREVGSGDEPVTDVGRPIATVTVSIHDETGAPLPPDVVGLIRVRGPSTAMGTLRADGSVEPFSTDGSFATGDHGRLTPAGDLHVLGRADQVINVGGERVSLLKVEAVLRLHPRVEDVIVVGAREPDGEQWPLACITGPDPPARAELTQHLMAHLPFAAWPRRVHYVREWPLLPNGKPDRRAVLEAASLPAGGPSRSPRLEGLAPRRGADRMSPVEQALAELWAEVLTAGDVGPDDEFVALGGDSLAAAGVVARVQDAFQVALDPTVLLGGATLAQVARRLEEALIGDSSTSPVERRGAVAAPLSFAQQRLWFLEKLDPHSSTYHLAQARRLKGPLDRRALEAALEELARRHEALRTTFDEADGQPRQVVLPVIAGGLSYAEVADEDALRRHATRAAQAPFDLARGPLWRALLLHRADGPADEHVLALVVHHLVADGWSQGVLWRELGTLYGAHHRGVPAALPPPAISPLDFAAWEREELTPERLQRSLDYWRAQLAGHPGSSELPADDPGVPHGDAGGAGARCRLALEPALTARLVALGRAEGATFYTTVLAALALLLSRYDGQPDVTVGCPTSRRPRAATRDTVGLFVNTLVLRLAAEPAQSFRALLAQARQVTLEAYAHQNVPFERLVEELAPAPARHRPPLFQVLLNALPPAELGVFPGLAVERAEVTEPEPRFELTVYLEGRGDATQVVLVYDRRRFSAPAAQRILRQFERLLAEVAEYPDRPMREHSLLTPADEALLPDPRRAVPAPPQGTAPQLFAAAARRSPGAPAVHSQLGACSYGALAAAASTIAAALAARRVGPGAVVAVTGERSPGLVAALVAALGRGTLLTLDPDLPDERKRLLVGEARAQVLVCVGAGDAFVAAAGLPVLRVDPATGTTEGAAVPSPRPGSGDAPGSDQAYVFFTSGTTGTPRGVLGSHAGLAHFVSWQRETFAVGPADRVAFTTGLSFDVVLREVLTPLVSGAALCVPPASPGLEWLADAGVTILHVVPTVASAWLAAAPTARCPDLRLVFFAGEPLTDALVRRWRAACPRAEVVNLYGPTETTLAKCWYRVPAEPRAGVQPLGRPLPDTQALVLRDHRRLCAVGELGEICLRTPFRTHGYLDATAAERARFFPNPHRDDPADLLYATGDLGRYTGTGELAFHGRRDQQVKIRGVRVEPDEVAAILARHPGVAACAVVPGEDAAGGTELHAYVVPDAGDLVTGDALRRHLAASLPLALVPARFTFLATIPKTPSGKVDRRALCLPPAPTPPLPVAPRTPIEESLLDVWREVLGRAVIGVHDSFFDLGGHSLLALRVAARVVDRFGTELALRAFFEAPTVAELARRIEERLGGPAPDALPIPRRGLGEAPLSSGQARLWFLHRLAPDSRAYTIAQARRLEHADDPAAIAAALAEVVRRHEALRTRFPTRNGQPVQVIGEPFAPQLPTVDVATDAELPAALTLAAREPFDLERGPLVRAALFRVPTGATTLLVTVHHIVADGWSMAIVWRELAALLAARRAGQPCRLPLPAVQYADYAVWEQERRDAVVERDREFWRGELRGCPGVWSLPLDRERPRVASERGARCEVDLEAGLTAQLRALARDEGCTLYMTLLAGLAVVLWRATGQSDLVVGCPTAGRGRRETEGTVGFFVNTLALRVDVSGEPSFRELMRRVRDLTLRAAAHGDAPFELLVENLAPERDLGRNPLFQVMLALFHAPPADGLGARVDVDVRAAKLDLAFMLVDEGEQGVHGRLEYATDLFERDTATRLARRFEAVLRGAVVEPASAIGDLVQVDEAERRLVVETWNATARAYPPATIDGLFARQALREPAAVALEGGGERWTYAALDRRAHDVARRLHALGLGPEARVAIALARRPAAVAAMLGVLRAGGAFVPFDPNDPTERVRWILEDAGIAVLVTTRDLAERLPAHPTPRLLLEELESSGTPVPAAAHDASSLAYVLYTSGSTGRPKGVMGTHRGLCNRMQWMWEAYPFAPGERCCHKTSLGFVDSLWEIFGPLCAGVPAVIVPDAALADPRALVATLAAERVTRLVLVPSLLQLLLDTTPRLGPALPHLVHWTSSGEELPPALARRFRAAAPAARLLNLYGSSEVAADATAFDVTGWSGSGRVPIGRPIANLEVLVLDERMRPLGVGMPGELWVGGAGLSRGYHGQPGLTAERFVPHPWRSGEVLHRTGDLGRWLSTGQLEYLERRDGQVRIRGCRVELGEIEEVLRRHVGVREVAVVPVGEGAERRLVAHVVGDAKPRELRRLAADYLPSYMVPSALVAAMGLPRTASGKLDRRRLASRAVEEAPLDSAYIAPRSALEEQLAAAFAHVLDRDRVSVHDSFFEIGGHSLLVVRLTAELEQRLGLRVAVATIFRAPTVAALAAVLEHPAATPSLVVPIRAAGRLPPLVLVHPIGGALFCYQKLARLLDDRQVLGIQAAGLEPGATPLDSIEDLAKRYVDVLVEVQGRGPYLLGGWSMGGVIAHEMARQLVDRGELVGLVAMIDSSAEPPRSRRILEDETLHPVRFSHHQALEKHRPAPYAGRIVLFRAAATTWAPDLGWGAVAPRLEVEEVAGSHQTVLEFPQVEALAARLGAHLLAAEAELAALMPAASPRDAAR